MKLISYNKNGKVHIGALENEMVYPLHELNAQIADNMKDLLPGEFSIREKDIMDRLKSVVQDIKELGYTISASQVKDTDALGGLV